MVFLKQERGFVAKDDLGPAVPRDVDAPAPEGEELDAGTSEETSAAGSDDGSAGEPILKRRAFRLPVKLLALIAIVYFFVLPTIPGFRSAATQLGEVQPQWLVLGLGLQMAALVAYSLLTRAAIGEARHFVSTMRMFRIQMSTKALSNVVPGGTAAGSALGYRLITLSGVTGTDAGFALATAGLASAVVLNLIFWLALLVSIPRRGVNPLYTTAALAGVLIMVFVAAIVIGLLQGQKRADSILRWIARRLRLDENKIGDALRQVGERLEDLVHDRQVLRRVLFWSTLNWLLDAASLWVFIRAFGATLDFDALLVAFGLANVFAVIPITPGGLGIVEGIYIPTLVGFNLRRSVAVVSVATYRIAQYFFPTLLGGLMYLSLRVGPFRIERREELQRLRDLAREDDETRETAIDFVLKSARKRTVIRDGDVVAVVDDTGSTQLSEGSWCTVDDDGDFDENFPHNPT